MSKRKIDTKVEFYVPEIVTRKSRRCANLLKGIDTSFKVPEAHASSDVNKTLSVIKSESKELQICRRSSRLKENILPNINNTASKAIKNATVSKKSKDIVKEEKDVIGFVDKPKNSTVSIVKTIKAEKLYPNVKSKNESDIEIPVDRECHSKIGIASVFVDGKDVFDVMLNQTNLQFNNNKFYIIQLLKDNDNEIYSVWMRWARVGRVGQMKLTNFGKNLEGAIECFSKKFHDKTKNHWDERSDFEKVDGKYDLVHIDYLKKETCPPKIESNKVKLEPMECRLNEKLQDLLKIIFDIKEMDSAVSALNYDSNRLPLGRLTDAQIKAGYKSLREIEGLLNEGYSSNSKLVSACNAYYTRIPHDFGMRPPPIIRSLQEIKQELSLLETLSDIKITLDLMDMGDINRHPLDRQYESLKCDIKPVFKDENIYEVLNDYLIKTHGTTHKEYSLEMLELFEVKKEKEWNDFEDVGNRMLLWHGSRTTNYGGILSQGLRIAPPEAPVTGHMFGKGVYFSDTSSKSANYIYCTRTKNIGFLLLCEVSLGNCRELIKADSRAARLPTNMNSVMGRGMIAPDRSTWVTTADGMVIPVGEPRDTGLAAQHKQSGYLLNYNEYIVYNRNQIRIRYMIKVKFNYK